MDAYVSSKVEKLISQAFSASLLLNCLFPMVLIKNLYFVSSSTSNSTLQPSINSPSTTAIGFSGSSTTYQENS